MCCADGSSVHQGELEPLQILEWLHEQLGTEQEARCPVTQFDLSAATDRLRVVLEVCRAGKVCVKARQESNQELRKLNVDTFTHMFSAITECAQPTLQQLLAMLQHEDSDVSATETECPLSCWLIGGRRVDGTFKQSGPGLQCS